MEFAENPWKGKRLHVSTLVRLAEFVSQEQVHTCYFLVLSLTWEQCDELKPKCTACVTRETDCRHGETESRKFKRRYQQLKEKRTAQEELFDMLQNLPERDAASVFRRIRAGANAEAVVKHIQEGNMMTEASNVPRTSSRFRFPYLDTIPPSLRESAYFRSLVSEAIEALDNDTEDSQTHFAFQRSNYERPFSSAKLVDPLLEDAQLSHWTSVSSNDRLLRNILESYFINQYPRQFFFVKNYFLEDMVSRRAEFCSPLLVNALLAKSCVSECTFLSWMGVH